MNFETNITVFENDSVSHCIPVYVNLNVWTCLFVVYTIEGHCFRKPFKAHKHVSSHVLHGIVLI